MENFIFPAELLDLIDSRHLTYNDFNTCLSLWANNKFELENFAKGYWCLKIETLNNDITYLQHHWFKVKSWWDMIAIYTFIEQFKDDNSCDDIDIIGVKSYPPIPCSEVGNDFFRYKQEYHNNQCKWSDGIKELNFCDKLLMPFIPPHCHYQTYYMYDPDSQAILIQIEDMYLPLGKWNNSEFTPTLTLEIRRLKFKYPEFILDETETIYNDINYNLVKEQENLQFKLSEPGNRFFKY